MMTEMKKMFDEKLQTLEKESNVLKEKTNKKDKKEYTLSEETLASRNKKSEGGRKHKLNEGETKTPEYSMESSSKTINSKENSITCGKELSKDRREEESDQFIGVEQKTH